LGRAWGVEMAPDAVADAAFALPVPVETGRGLREDLAHPLFLGIPAAATNREDPITADLVRVVNFGAPGALLPGTPPEGVTITPLVTTGPSPSFINAGDAARDMSPAEVLAAYRGLPQPLAIALRISGRLVTAFPGGAPAGDEADGPAAAAHIRSGEAPSEIVIIADADFIADEFYIVEGGGLMGADNGALVLNALDALSGGGELSRLRSRAPALRPMTRIDRMRKDAEEQYFRQQTELESRLQTAQARLAQLQDPSRSGGFFAGDPEADLSKAERDELALLREDILDLRGRLRETERDYRRGIDRLEANLKALNIWGGPLLVALTGILVWHRQRRPRRRPA
ncbi:MAG: Gldg family protein, partial [Hyphomonas sp.]